jgi:uncharacterized repeat protein (TIGR02543 family)
VTAENGATRTYTITATRAQAVPVKVKATFNPNGGKKLAKAKKTRTVTTTKTYGTLPTPKRTHYRFVGWYTAKKGGMRVTKATIVQNPKSHTLYAHWTKMTQYGKVKPKKLAIRAKSSTKAKTIGYWKKGKTFKIISKIDRKGTKKDFYKIKYNGKTAYLAANHIKVTWK